MSGLPFTGSRPISPLKNRAGSGDSLETATVGTRSMSKLALGEGPVVQWPRRGLSRRRGEWNGSIQRTTCTPHVT